MNQMWNSYLANVAVFSQGSIKGVMTIFGDIGIGKWSNFARCTHCEGYSGYIISRYFLWASVTRGLHRQNYVVFIAGRVSIKLTHHKLVASIL